MQCAQQARQPGTRFHLREDEQRLVKHHPPFRSMARSSVKPVMSSGLGSGVSLSRQGRWVVLPADARVEIVVYPAPSRWSVTSRTVAASIVPTSMRPAGLIARYSNVAMR
jgi:hypothetical protein